MSAIYKWEFEHQVSTACTTSLRQAITWERYTGDRRQLKESIDKLKAMMLKEKDESIKINLAKAGYILNNLYLR
jgi:hypothetical protein